MTGVTRTGGALTAGVVPRPLPVMAEIEGVLPRASFPGLSDAAGALETALRQCRMGAQQLEYVEGCLTGVGAFEYVTGCLERDGAWSLTVYLIDGAGAVARGVGHSIRITALKAAEQP